MTSGAVQTKICGQKLDKTMKNLRECFSVTDSGKDDLFLESEILGMVLASEKQLFGRVLPSEKILRTEGTYLDNCRASKNMYGRLFCHKR